MSASPLSCWPPGKEIWRLWVSTVSVRRVSRISTPLVDGISGTRTPARTRGGAASTTDRSRGVSARRSRLGHVLEDDGVDPHHRVSPNPNARQYRSLASDPDVVLDDHRPGPVGSDVPLNPGRPRLVVTHLARTEHAVGAHLDPCGSGQRASIQADVAADADHRLPSGRPHVVDLGVRPGVDVLVQDPSPSSADSPPAIGQQTRTDPNPPAQPVGKGGEDPEPAGRPPFPGHAAILRLMCGNIHKMVYDAVDAGPYAFWDRVRAGGEAGGGGGPPRAGR